jgi:hypothetical protein
MRSLSLLLAQCADPLPLAMARAPLPGPTLLTYFINLHSQAIRSPGQHSLPISSTCTRKRLTNHALSFSALHCGWPREPLIVNYPQRSRNSGHLSEAPPAHRIDTPQRNVAMCHFRPYAMQQKAPLLSLKSDLQTWPCWRQPATRIQATLLRTQPGHRPRPNRRASHR